MSEVTATVCRTCPLGRDGFAETLRKAAGGVCRIEEVDCMSGCTHPSTVAFRADGKTAYLFGDLVAADLDDLRRFAELYLRSPDGEFDDARVLGDLRMKALARIPG